MDGFVVVAVNAVHERARSTALDDKRGIEVAPGHIRNEILIGHVAGRGRKTIGPRNALAETVGRARSEQLRNDLANDIPRVVGFVRSTSVISSGRL